MIPLFERFPGLKEKLPYIGLGTFPTPVHRLEKLGKILGIHRLYIKQDGFSAQPFGGNKIRKLEFLLGEALSQKAKSIITSGFAGSNHSLATAVCARGLDLKSISLLMPQSNAYYVRRNLAMSFLYNAELHCYPTKKRLNYAADFHRWKQRWLCGKVPYMIPPGGTSPVGVLGFVNAAFELKQQVDRGEIPEPDFLYLAMGTAGTAAGLMIGLKVLGLKTRVIPIRIIDPLFMPPSAMVDIVSGTVELLRSKDGSFPFVQITEGELGIRDEFVGDGYARFTDKGMDAVRLIRKTEDVRLDGTYTGKAFSAIVEDARQRKLADRVVLFWNTLNAHDFPDAAQCVDYHRLPRVFRRFFEEDVQSLDMAE